MPDVFTHTPHNATPHTPKPPHQKHKVGLFGSFCPRPEGITFASQESHEQILLFLRRHFITNLSWIIITILLFLLPLILPFISFLFEGIIPRLSPQLVFVVSSLYYLLVFSYALVHYISWFYNTGIVTDNRVVDVDATNILHHNVAATAVSDIIDAEYSQKGILQSLFDFGDVMIQTEGLKANFEFHATPKPSIVSDTILDVKEGRANDH